MLDPGRGALARQLECLRMLHDGLDPGTPFIQTIFNPLSVAKYLAGDETLLVHLRRHPEVLHAGLRTITASTVAFVREVMRRGAAGLFLAVQHAQYGLLSEGEYAEFGEPYDLEVLEAAEGAWFHLLHLHGEEVMFARLARYPVQAVNWHDRETPPTLSVARERFRGALCGACASGRRWWGTPEDAPRGGRRHPRDARAGVHPGHRLRDADRRPDREYPRGARGGGAGGLRHARAHAWGAQRPAT